MPKFYGEPEQLELPFEEPKVVHLSTIRPVYERDNSVRVLSRLLGMAIRGDVKWCALAAVIRTDEAQSSVYTDISRGALYDKFDFIGATSYLHDQALDKVRA